ncbi:MAG: ABC transporter permease [Chrysiogenetes bacterium]|nr:ABC transporter permease [Chrysiogenetes bacterium]
MIARLKKNPIALASACFIALALFVALFAEWLAPYSYGGLYPDAILLPPDGGHLFGTDRLGRDLLSRVLYGTRVSVLIGVTAALGSSVIGFFYGALAGLAGKRTEGALMRVVDAVYGLPELLLIVLLSLIFGRGPLSLAMALAMVGWTRIARIVRGEVLRIRVQQYYESSLALGVGFWRRLIRYVLPNLLSPLLVATTLSIPLAILTESVISFIGLGINDPYSAWGTSWGTLAREGWQGLRTYPHLLLFPSLAIFATALSFNLLGDWLRDELDPRTRPTQ